MNQPEQREEPEPGMPAKGSGLIVALLGVWAILVLFSVLLPLFTEPTSDGFTRGLNRIGIFLGWQAAAFIVSLVSFFLTRARKGILTLHMRRAGRMPLFAHALVLFGIICFVVYAVATN